MNKLFKFASQLGRLIALVDIMTVTFALVFITLFVPHLTDLLQKMFFIPAVIFAVILMLIYKHLGFKFRLEPLYGLMFTTIFGVFGSLTLNAAGVITSNEALSNLGIILAILSVLRMTHLANLSGPAMDAFKAKQVLDKENTVDEKVPVAFTLKAEVTRAEIVNYLIHLARNSKESNVVLQKYCYLYLSEFKLEPTADSTYVETVLFPKYIKLTKLRENIRSFVESDSIQVAQIKDEISRTEEDLAFYFKKLTEEAISYEFTSIVETANKYKDLKGL